MHAFFANLNIVRWVWRNTWETSNEKRSFLSNLVILWPTYQHVWISRNFTQQQMWPYLHKFGLLENSSGNKHERERYKCPHCDYQATQKGDLAIHRKSEHDGVINQCDLCDYKSSAQRSVMLHKKSHHVAWSWIFVFVVMMKYTAHVLRT